MFDEKSRYANLPTASHVTPDGRTIVHVRRRFLPPSEDLSTLTETMLKDEERLDLFTARTLGDAEQFWRICDANDALPEELEEESGEILRVPVPRPEV